MKGIMWGAGAVLLAGLFTVPGRTAHQEQAAPSEVEGILQRFVADFRADRSLHEEVTFSLQIAEGRWHVIARPGATGQANEVELRIGDPPSPTFYYRMSEETLRRIDRGELNALTASVQAFSTDPAPLRVGLMEGAPRDPATIDRLQRILFHFWTTGFPEMIPFGESLTRFTHGTDAVVLYYQQGFRSGWFSLKPGQHANQDPRTQINRFPTMLIITTGRARGRIGGKEVEGQAGQAFLIPAGTAHEFWNPYGAPAEGLLLMFGPGA